MGDEEPTGRLRRFLLGPEGGLFYIGLLLAAAVVAELVVFLVLWPPVGRALGLGLGTEVFTGREAGIPVGLSEGAPAWLVFQLSVLQDLAAAFLVYPWFLLILHRYRDADNFLMRRVQRIETAAERHQKYVHRWGPIGLFLFMLIPFLVNGPLVGLLIGRIAGMRTPYIIPPVVASTVVAAAAWTFFFDAMIQYADAFDERWGTWITLGVIAIVLMLVLVDVLQDWRRQRDDVPDEEE